MSSEQQKAELFKSIWKIANTLRWSIDGWDFKNYVLWFLFYRFISENLTDYINELQKQSWDENFDYSKLSDEEALQAKNEITKAKWFFILPSELFQNIRKKVSNDQNLNETLEKIFRNIEASSKWYPSEKDLKWLFKDIDVNSPKLWNTVEQRNRKLVEILNAIWELNFWNYKQNKIDTFWDTYEYLMQMYASNAWKSWGEFFTPQEVSELLAKIVIWNKEKINKVYDPACGSGSLLLKFAKILWKENIIDWFYWQEINLTTYNLARINMFLHDIWYEKFDITLWDTLIHPQHNNEKPFDAIVSNPPYSIKWEWSDNPLLINDERFAPAGVLAPKSKADLAFVMHILSYLSDDWTAAIVEFPWVLYRSWAEQKIRKYLVDNNFIDTVIQLPENLFYWTWIWTCIIVLKKNKKDNNILFIDASKEFIKAWIKNKLSEENINNILNIYKNKKEEKYKSKLISNKEIWKNEYNLSAKRYIEKEDTTEKIDIKELNKKIGEIVNKENKLREEINKIIQELEK